MDLFRGYFNTPCSPLLLGAPEVFRRLLVIAVVAIAMTMVLAGIMVWGRLRAQEQCRLNMNCIRAEHGAELYRTRWGYAVLNYCRFPRVQLRVYRDGVLVYPTQLLARGALWLRMDRLRLYSVPDIRRGGKLTTAMTDGEAWIYLLDKMSDDPQLYRTITEMKEGK